MRLIKMFGLAAITAVAAMALVGATSASATHTQLCNDHDGLLCNDPATSFGAIGEGVFLTSIVNILCLAFAVSGTPLGLANPQQIHITSKTYLGCGTKAGHNNCEVIATTLPLADLLKTGLDTGLLTFLNGSARIICDDIDIFGIDIECIYDYTGLTLSIGAQHLTADDTQIDKIGGELCPDETFLDGLMKTASPRYVLA